MIYVHIPYEDQVSIFQIISYRKKKLLPGFEISAFGECLNKVSVDL